MKACLGLIGLELDFIMNLKERDGLLSTSRCHFQDQNLKVARWVVFWSSWYNLNILDYSTRVIIIKCTGKRFTRGESHLIVQALQSLKVLIVIIQSRRKYSRHFTVSWQHWKVQTRIEWLYTTIRQQTESINHTWRVHSVKYF